MMDLSQAAADVSLDTSPRPQPMTPCTPTTGNLIYPSGMGVIATLYDRNEWCTSWHTVLSALIRARHRFWCSARRAGRCTSQFSVIKWPLESLCILTRSQQTVWATFGIPSSRFSFSIRFWLSYPALVHIVQQTSCTSDLVRSRRSLELCKNTGSLAWPSFEPMAQQSQL